MADAGLISGLEQIYMELTESYWEETVSEGFGLKKRDHLFTAAVTTWLMLWQKLLPENSIGAVLQEFQRKIASEEHNGILEWLSGSRKVKFSNVSSSTGGLSRARGRVSLEVVEGVADEISNRLSKENGSEKLWGSKRVYLIDGSDFAFINTAELKEAFPPQRNNTGDCFPISRVVVAHDLVTGVAVRPEIGTQYDSEQELAKRIMPRLERGAILLADRNFGVFSTAYHGTQNGFGVVFRMQKARAGRLIGQAKVDQDGEYQVEWRPSKDDRKTNPEIPADTSVKGRVIVITGARNGFRPQRFYFFVSVPEIRPEELLQFYAGRWHVETDIRSIKYCTNLETILAKDSEMVRKELILGVCAYNLVRAVIARGAKLINLTPREISFTRAVLLIKATSQLLINSTSNAQRKEIREKFLISLRQIRLPKRTKPRIEPRLVVRQKKSFPALRGSRQDARNKIIKELGQ